MWHRLHVGENLDFLLFLFFKSIIVSIEPLQSRRHLLNLPLIVARWANLVLDHLDDRNAVVLTFFFHFLNRTFATYRPSERFFAHLESLFDYNVWWPI